MLIVLWKPSPYKTIELKNSRFFYSTFAPHPHSPGNDGNGSIVRSSLFVWKSVVQILAEKCWGCTIRNGKRKTSQTKTGWKVLKGQSAYPLRFSGTGREKQTSFGNIWADWEKALSRCHWQRELFFAAMPKNGKAYYSFNVEHVNARQVFCFY
jgi:hypothetical protein